MDATSGRTVCIINYHFIVERVYHSPLDAVGERARSSPLQARVTPHHMTRAGSQSC